VLTYLPHLLSGDFSQFLVSCFFNLFPAWKDFCQGESQTREEKPVMDFSSGLFCFIKSCAELNTAALGTREGNGFTKLVYREFSGDGFFF